MYRVFYSTMALLLIGCSTANNDPVELIRAFQQAANQQDFELALTYWSPEKQAQLGFEGSKMLTSMFGKIDLTNATIEADCTEMYCYVVAKNNRYDDDWISAVYTFTDADSLKLSNIHVRR